MSGLHWTVGADEAGLRLDKFLAASGRMGSRTRASAALERGKVFVNDQEAGAPAAATRLAAGDVVRLWLDRPGSAKRPPSRGWRFGDSRDARGLQIVFEDDALIVLNKPAGLLAVPLERRGDARSVFEDLKEYLRKRRRPRPLVVHRIDRDTSGLVLFAKNALVHARLKTQFTRHLPERIYLAVVYGQPQPSSGTWRDHLVWDQKALIQKETHPRDPRAKQAISRYRVVETLKDASLVEVTLVTGRRNQIRLQARLRGHTLVGEQRYVYGPDSLRTIAFPRQALHAARLALDHPISGRRVSFEAPLPDDLVTLIAKLRRS